MGILDTVDFDPRTQGLLAAAFQGLQASGPSRMPVSLGQIIGQGGQAGIAQYGAANKAQIEELYRKAQIQNMMEERAIAREQLNKPVSVAPGSVLTTPQGKPLYENPQSRGMGTMQERSFGVLGQLHNKARLGGTLTPEENIQAQMARSILSREESRFDPATGQQIMYKPLTIPNAWKIGLDELPVTSEATQPATALTSNTQSRVASSPAGLAVPNEGPRKPLDNQDQKSLNDMANNLKQLGDLYSSFKPNYGGLVLDPIADFSIKAGRRLPESVLKKFGAEGLVDEANWWQRYSNWSNDVRAAKFGLTLTGNELMAFEKANPKPSDRPEQIQAGIQQQMDILSNAQARKVTELNVSGANREQISAAAGADTRAFSSDEEAKAAALAADKEGKKVVYKVAIPKEQFSRSKSKQFNIDGKKVLGTLGADGSYYTVSGGKKYKIEE